MIINSLLPPVSFHSVVDNQWYIATTDSKLGWVKVDRKYEWEELNKMWRKKTYGTSTKVVKEVKRKPVKQTYSVEGSKGNKYTVINDSDIWTCTCPAFGWGRGKECKHIKQIKK